MSITYFTKLQYKISQGKVSYEFKNMHQATNLTHEGKENKICKLF
jgi:hypothetical protein